MTLKIIWLMSLLAPLYGCGSPAPKDDPPQPDSVPTAAPEARDRPVSAINIRIVTGTGTNPDGAGRPSPLLLRLYELKDVSKFDATDFFDLYEHGQEVLGTTLLRSDEIMLTPGTQTAIALTPQPDMRFLGVFAAFRDLGSAQWRGTAPIEAGKTTGVEIRINGTQLTIAADTPAKPPGETH